MLQVRLLSQIDRSKWDDFVDSRDNGTLFHKLVWRDILQATFKFNPFYLLATENDLVQGVLPLFHTRSLFGGRALISTPFAVYGGILAKDNISESALAAAAGDLGAQLGVDYIEYRHRQLIDLTNLQRRDDLYFTFIKPLLPSPEENFSALPKEARRMARKGEQNGLQGRFDSSALDEFYHIYACSVRNLGTPVFPKRLFKNCMAALQDDASLLIIEHQGEAIAGVMSFYYKKNVMPYYGGSLSHANHLSPNNYMYWILMKDACEKGNRFFDFGRSKINTGVFDFKRHMGFEPQPLQYQYRMLQNADLPNTNPNNPKYRLAIQLWRRLPLGLTKLVGPSLVKYFP